MAATEPGQGSPGRRARGRRILFSRPALLLAFAFAVMADPVSSVAYAIEAALRALDGDLGLLFATMALVIAVVALVIANYHQVVARFPEGGGAAAAAGSAFGEGWAHHTPYWAVVVFLVISIAVVVAAGARDQELVLFYAVSVIMSFLIGLIAMAKFQRAEGRIGGMLVSVLGAVVIGFTLVVNLLRGYPIVSLAAAVGIAGVLHWLWVGGPAAEKFLDGQPHADTYWLRVWGLRGLLWAWDDTALPEVRLALDDEHWRVREMAIKVISEHLLGDFIPAAAEIDDPVPRVRQAAHLALTRLTAGGA